MKLFNPIANKESLLHFCTALFTLLLMTSCGGTKTTTTSDPIIPNIDLSHWKVTIPTPRPDGSGKPIEYDPDELKNYTEIEGLKEFMYADNTDGSIVFYTYPYASTANSKYSRSELREQMIPGDNSTNWTFKDGGYMKVTMSVPKVTKEKRKSEALSMTKDPKPRKGHRVIIAQIHGKLTKEQQKLIGQKDTNAPPILKVYYRDGKVQVKRKILKVRNPSPEEILVTKNWIDDEGYFFDRFVGKKKFTLEVFASDGRLEVKLDGKESTVYEDEHMKHWNVFDNYFKTGNYLTTRDKGGHAKVKIYDLEVSH